MVDACPCLCFHCASDFLGNIPCVKIVEQVLERCHLVISRRCVNTVTDCYVAYLLAWEIHICVITRLQIITPKTGKVFCNDCIDFPAFNVCNHSLKIRAFIVCATPTVINVGFHNLYAVVFRKLCEHLLLACYGIAFPVNVSVVNRQAGI